jgi:protein gp37
MAYRLKGRAGYPADNPFRPTFHPDRLSEPEKWRNPQVVACNFMGDWMDAGHANNFKDDWTPNQNIKNVYYKMALCKKHTYLTLTKNPWRLLELTRRWAAQAGWPVENIWNSPNIYNGLTITNQADADEKLPIFLQIPGKKWLSIEPCVGGIKLKPNWFGLYDTWSPGYINQVILGGMSGPKATPLHPDWVRQVRDDCAAAGVPFFFKQWGEYLTEETTFCGRPARLSKKVGKQAAGRMLDGREHNDLAWGEK